MMKLVYFMDTRTPLVGEAKALLELLAQEALVKEKEVFYVNNAFVEEKIFCEAVGIKHIDLKDLNSADFEDAVIITKVNYLIVLLTYFNKVWDARVILFNDNDLAALRLKAQVIKRTKNNLADLGEILALTDSCVHISGESLAEMKREMKNAQFPNSFLPVYSVDCEVYAPLLPTKIINEEVNIGWYGTVTPEALKYLDSMLRDLAALSFKKNVVLHIISKGVTLWNAGYQAASPKVKVVFLGEIPEESATNYLRDNVDVVVASGKEAIISSLACVPTLVQLNETTVKNKRGYVYINKSLSFDLFPKEKRIQAMKDSTTLMDALYQIYVERKKKEIAEQCRSFARENFSTDENLKRLSMLINDTKLTVDKLRESVCVKKQLEDYDKFRKRTKKPYIDYIDYASKQNKRRSTSIKTRFLSAIKNNKNNAVKSVKACYKKARKKIARILPSSIVYKRFYKQQKSFKKKKKNIANIIHKDGRIKVGFLVVFGSVFPTRPVFEKMLTEQYFDPYIIVIPTVSRSMKYQRDTYKESFKALSEIYQDKVINGYDIDHDTYLDLKDEYKILFFANPYKEMVHPIHNIEYFVDKDVLPIYASYGFAALAFWDEVIKTDFYNYLWKACVETESNLKHLEEKQKIKGKNGVVTGYLKMDSLALLQPTERTRKRILICPHHTVWGWGTLNISNFLKYAELFIDLPKRYPDIDFIFRPHPLLFPNLKAHRVWTQSQIDEFFEKMFSSPNIIYDKSGDYYQQFVDSDAMIHDCGSFIGEYLYTKKPCCYMMKTEEETMQGLVPLGQACMKQYYHAFDEKDIINFIEKVVVRGEDEMQSSREEFVEKELKVNYPKASEFLIEKIKEELSISD